MNDQMQRIKEWREKAFAITASEPEIGTVTSMSFDLIITVLRDGILAQNLMYPVKSLQREWEFAFKNDKKKHEHLRTLLYGMSDSFGLMILDMAERGNKAAEVEILPVFKEESSDAADTPENRLKSAKEWREKASAISNSDPPMGTLISRSLELIISVMRDGVEASHLLYSIDSLRREREYAMENDKDKDTPLRNLLYGMSESLGTLIRDIVEKSKAKMMEVVSIVKEELVDDDADAMVANSSNEESPIKMEQLELDESKDQANHQPLFDNAVKSEEPDFPEPDGSDHSEVYANIMGEEDDAPSTSSQASLKRPRFSGSYADLNEGKMHAQIAKRARGATQRRSTRDSGANEDHGAAGTTAKRTRPSAQHDRDSSDAAGTSGSPGPSGSAAEAEVPVSRCNICSMTFPEADNAGLARHVKMHKGWDCLVCNKYLVNGDLLAAHMAHEHPFFIAASYKHPKAKQDRRYQCEFCPQTCRTPSALLQHERTHTGDRPFACTFLDCKSSFTSSSFQKAHLREMHGIDPHQCEVCEERFGKIEELRKHWAEKKHRRLQKKNESRKSS